MPKKSKVAPPARKKSPSPAAAGPRRWRWVVLGVGLIAVAFVAQALWVLPSSDEVARLSRRPPHSTALIDERATEAREQGKHVVRQQRWVPIGEVAPELVACVIASEDARFFDHDGVDVKELREALRKDLRTHHFTRGASTLTQQLAKNLWLSENKSLLRKLQEVVLARRLEDELTKERILELYVNEVEWGDGIYGIAAASRATFGKDPRALTLAQSAMLAAMLPAPRRLSPKTDAIELLPRARHVLDRVAEEHLAAPAAIALARDELDRALTTGPRNGS